MDILDAIGQITAGKVEKGVFPQYATSIEVARLTGMGVHEVDEAAVQLEAQGLISIGKGLNYNYYKLK